MPPAGITVTNCVRVTLVPAGPRAVKVYVVVAEGETVAWVCAPTSVAWAPSSRLYPRPSAVHDRTAVEPCGIEE